MPTTDERVSAVRAFNRFHTSWVGALDPGLHGTPWSLPEARVLWELGQAGGRVRRPLLELDEREKAAVRAAFEGCGLRRP